MEQRKAVFLDKDGTLATYVHYHAPPRKTEILQDAIMFEQIRNGLRYLQERGFALIIVSNQPWIGKGIVTYDEVDTLFQVLVRKFAKQGITILDYAFCPHSKTEYCSCRKPKPGLVLRMARMWNIDLAASYIVGDSKDDILLGKELDLQTILVQTGIAALQHERLPAQYVIADVNEISKVIR